MEEKKKLQRKTKNKNEEEGPIRIPKNQICVNLTNCKYQLIEDVMKNKLNWKVFKNDEENLNCDIIWYDCASRNDLLSKLRPFQKTNHFPGIISIARKNFLAYNLNKMKKKFPDYYNFFPETYCLPTDNSKVYNEFSDRRKKKNFIIKPEGACQGKGIFLINKFEQIPFNENYIMQRYIENPLLIEDTKFDLRIYALVTSVSPLTVYLYNEGIARFSTDLYEKPNNNNLKNQYQHLTNYALNKNSKKFFYSENAEEANIGHKRSLKAIWNILAKKGIDTVELINKIKKIVLKTLCSIQPVLEHMYKSCQVDDISGSMCFEILGFDILIDENYQPFLLEVNHAPSFNSDTPFDIKNKSELIYGAMQIIKVNLEIRNHIISEMKNQFKNRMKTGKRTVLDLDQKILLKNQFRKKFYDSIDIKALNFEKIFPLENCPEPYTEFMEFASNFHKIKTGVNSEKKKIIKKQLIQRNSLKKTDSVIYQSKNNSLKKKSKNDLDYKKKNEIILNSINRLYKKDFLINKENRINNNDYQKKNFFKEKPTPCKIIKTSIVNLELNF